MILPSEKKGKDHQGTIKRTPGQSQREIVLRVGGGDGWGRREWLGENGDNCT